MSLLQEETELNNIRNFTPHSEQRAASGDGRSLSGDRVSRLSRPSTSSGLKVGTYEEIPDEIDKRSIFHSIEFYGVLLIVVLVLVVIPLTYFVVIHLHYDELSADPSIHSCSVTEDYRIPCGAPNISASYCTSIRCCFDTSLQQCYHYVPSQYLYRPVGTSDEGSGNGQCVSRAYWPSPVYTATSTSAYKELRISYSAFSEDCLQIVLHTPDIDVCSVSSADIANPNFNVKMHDDRLAIEVTRTTSQKSLLLSSALGPLMASDKYWEWTIQLSTEYLFGMGTLLLPINTTITKVFYDHIGDHGTRPYFLATNGNGMFHALLIEHTGALEVTVLPSRQIIMRALSGNRLSLWLTIGPSPEEALRQMRHVLGSQTVLPVMVPYQAFQPHLCRDGPTSIKEAMDEYLSFHRENTVHYASDCIHEDLFQLYLDNPEEKAVMLPKQYPNVLLSFSPQLPNGSVLASEASDLNMLYLNRTSEDTFTGSVRGIMSVFPDYLTEKVADYMRLVKENVDNMRIPFNGLVLRDEWPMVDDANTDGLDYFNYMSTDLYEAMSSTLPWNSYSGQQTTDHFQHHNDYGVNFFSSVTALQPENDGSFLYFSTSANLKSRGDLLVVHYQQNVRSSWTELRRVLRHSLQHSIFLNPLVSVPVCGTNDDFDPDLHESLCIRWYLAAATMPIMRISSTLPRRDPLNLPSKYARNVAEQAIRKHNALLPYIRTTLADGGVVLQPMFYRFYTDIITYSLDEQYMLGSDLLVAQPLTPNSVIHRVYLPKQKDPKTTQNCPSLWYEFDGGRQLMNTDPNPNEYVAGQWIEFPVVESDWLMCIEGGTIIPYGNVDEEAVQTLSLKIALRRQNCSPAKGSLMYNSHKLIFEATHQEISITNILAVQSDIGCSTESTIAYKMIKDMYVYGQDDMNWKKYSLSLDICTFEDDVYTQFIPGPSPD